MARLHPQDYVELATVRVPSWKAHQQRDFDSKLSSDILHVFFGTKVTPRT